MSLYSLAGIDLPTAQTLSRRLEKMGFIEQMVMCCMVCKKAKREELHVLINYELVEHLGGVDLVMICLRCRQEMKGQPTVSIKHLIAALSAILQHPLAKPAIPLLTRLFTNIRAATPTIRYNPERLVKEINHLMLGTDETPDEAEVETEAGETPFPRTCQLVRAFYCQLQHSDIGEFYRSLFGEQIKMESTLVNFLRAFCRRECAYKLDVLNRAGELSSRTRNARDVFQWVRRGVRGVELFRYAFAATPRNLHHTLFSICRTSIQFRYVYDEEQTQCECQLLTTEFPFSQQPSIFRLSSFGFVDQVQIGLFFAKRNLSKGCQAGSPPMLFRFRVGSQLEKQKKRGGASLDRLNRDSKSYSQSKIVLKNSSKGKGKKKRETVSVKVEDQDEVQVKVDYIKEVVKIRNRTQEKDLLEVPIKSGLTAKFFIFPCVRLVGTRVMVQSLPE